MPMDIQTWPIRMKQGLSLILKEFLWKIESIWAVKYMYIESIQKYDEYRGYITNVNECYNTLYPFQKETCFRDATNEL